MSFGIKPLGSRVVIKRVEAESKTASGIVLTGQAKEQPQIAEVLAVGPGLEDCTMELEVGDMVFLPQYAGATVKFEGTEYMILDQREILAKLDK